MSTIALVQEPMEIYGLEQTIERAFYKRASMVFQAEVLAILQCMINLIE